MSPFEASFGTTRVKEALVVRLEGNGIESFVECVAEQSPYYSYEYNRMSWDVISRYIIPSLNGTEFSSPMDFASATGRVRGYSMAKARVEMALWDMFARNAKQPLSGIIGGVKSRIELGISIGMQKAVDDLLRVISNSADVGYRRIKVEIRTSWDTNVFDCYQESLSRHPTAGGCECNVHQE